MCSFKSGVIFKNRVVLAPDGNESHSDLLESLGIRDDYLSASTLFVRVELTPKNNNKAMPVQDWEYIVDQDIKPDWFKKDPDKYRSLVVRVAGYSAYFTELSSELQTES